MKSLAQRLRRLEGAHTELRFAGLLEFNHATETAEAAIARAGAPGIYLVMSDRETGMQLVAIDSGKNGLEVVDL